DREPLSLIGHNGPVSSVSFSPDGLRIVTGSYDYTAKVWEVATGRELLTLKGHTRPVSSVAFSSDGQRIVTGSWDRTAKVWEAARTDQVDAWDEEERAATNSRPRWERELVALQREQAAQEKRQRIALARGDEGAIRKWLVLAPIKLDADGDGAQPLDREQIRGEGGLRPKAGERMVFGGSELKWQVWAEDDYAIDFKAISGGETNQCVAYAVCYIWSEAEQRGLQVLVGSDDGAKV
ncbi:MAG: hypothetical protein ABI651_08980, partial [Verrucomicrobiota bacterium]